MITTDEGQFRYVHIVWLISHSWRETVIFVSAHRVPVRICTLSIHGYVQRGSGRLVGGGRGVQWVLKDWLPQLLKDAWG